MECSSVGLVFEFRWLHIIFKSAEVVLAKLGLPISLETLIKRRLLALVILCVNGSAGSLCEGLAEEIL